MPSTAHQRAVRRTARELETDGWNVRADAGHWPNPPTIAGRQPDVVATKRGSRRIIEVETNTNTQRAQTRNFSPARCTEDEHDLLGYIVDSAGWRVEQFE